MFAKNAYLEVLDLTVPLRWFQKYQDLGPVENIKDYVEKRWRSLGRRLTQDELYLMSTEREKVRHNLGITVVDEVSEGFSGLLGIKMEVISIAYQPSDNQVINTFNQAQQETYALRALGQLKILEEMIKAEHSVHFNGLEPDNVADLGGIYGLLRNGYGAERIIAHGNNRIRSALNVVKKTTSAPDLVASNTSQEDYD